MKTTTSAVQRNFMFTDGSGYKMEELKKLKQALTKESSLNYENYTSSYEMWKAVLDKIDEMVKRKCIKK